MKLTTVSIKNFRSIKRLEFEFPESGFLVLVGTNNAGKSNIIRAIDAICGDGWFSRDKMEDHDFYLCNRQNHVTIEMQFDSGASAVFDTSSKDYPEYFDQFGKTIYANQAKIKDDFPCTYLGADRTLDKHLSFNDWTLIGRIRKAFHKKANNLREQLNRKFDELIEIFDQVENFSKFKSDFSDYFEEMQADTEARLQLDFKPFTPR